VRASGNYTVAGTGTKPCGGVLAAGGVCNIAITFSPTLPGTSLGAVSFSNDSVVTPQIYDLQGTAVLPVTIAPAALTFAAQSVGTTSPPQTITIINTHSTALSINGIVASGQYTATPGGTTPCGTSLAVWTACTVTVTFSPATTGTIGGAVTVTHSAPYSPQAIKLTGTGSP
ncbi:MAG TPA: choice-of-anchor D domain-containing protein, partial [Bryobacteraceae bacterium]|nr:choice-of-anchor D domain-containing protein [Bryobacteraceae bacterium]